MNIWTSHKSGLILPSREIELVYSDLDYEKYINKRRAPFQPLVQIPTKQATVSVVQMGGTTDSLAGATSITSTALTITAGNRLHVFSTVDDAFAFGTVSSSPSQTWTALGEVDSPSDTQRMKHWISNSTVGGSTTVTVAFTGGSADARGITVKEIGGTSGYDSVAGAHAEQLQATPTLTTNALSSGSTPTLTSQPALLSGFCIQLHLNQTTPTRGTTPATWTLDGSGWTFGGSTNLMVGESLRVTSTAAAAARLTANVNDSHATFVAAFLESAPAAGFFSRYYYDLSRSH